MRINHRMLRKMALVALAITSVAATSGVADAGFKPSGTTTSDCIAAENPDVASLCSEAPAMSRAGIRW